MAVELLVGDVREVISTISDKRFQACVTSPPYWGLRDYKHPDQIGLEPDPRDYIRDMVNVFREVRRTLRDDGTLWMNMGDCYVTGATAKRKKGSRGYSERTQDAQNEPARNGYPFGLPAKNLVMMPARLALALQEDGWILRADIIWAKPSPMPESVYDRPTTSHEHIFLFSKSARYFYDFEAVKEPVTGGSKPRRGDSYETKVENRGARGKTVNRAPRGWDTSRGSNHHQLEGNYPQEKNNESFSSAVVDLVHSRNLRSVWNIASSPFKGAHFATFPPALAEKCILAGSAVRACEICAAPWRTEAIEKVETGGRGSGNLERQHRINAGGNQTDLHKAHQGFGFPWTPTTAITDIRPTCKCEGALGSSRSQVLDCFGGAGTTGLVAGRLGRDCTLIELNAGYAQIADRRIHDDSPLFSPMVQKAP